MENAELSALTTTGRVEQLSHIAYQAMAYMSGMDTAVNGSHAVPLYISCITSLGVIAFGKPDAFRKTLHQNPVTQATVTLNEKYSHEVFRKMRRQYLAAADIGTMVTVDVTILQRKYINKSMFMHNHSVICRDACAHRNCMGLSHGLLSISIMCGCH